MSVVSLSVYRGSRTRIVYVPAGIALATHGVGPSATTSRPDRTSTLTPGSAVRTRSELAWVCGRPCSTRSSASLSSRADWYRSSGSRRSSFMTTPTSAGGIETPASCMGPTSPRSVATISS